MLKAHKYLVCTVEKYLRLINTIKVSNVCYEVVRYKRAVNVYVKWIQSFRNGFLKGIMLAIRVDSLCSEWSHCAPDDQMGSAHSMSRMPPTCYLRFTIPVPVGTLWTPFLAHDAYRPWKYRINFNMFP